LDPTANSDGKSYCNNSSFNRETKAGVRLTKREIKNIEERVSRLDNKNRIDDFIIEVIKLLPKDLGNQIMKFGQSHKFMWHKLLRTFTDQELEKVWQAIKQVSPKFPPTFRVPYKDRVPINHSLTLDMAIVKGGRDLRRNLELARAQGIPEDLID